SKGTARFYATAAAANTSTGTRRSGQIFTGTIIRGSIWQFASNWNGSHIRRFWGQRTRPQSNWRGKLLNIFPRKLCRVCFIPMTARLESKRRCALPHNFFTCGARNELGLSRFAAVTTAILRVRRRWVRRRCFVSMREVGGLRFAPLLRSENWEDLLADRGTEGL